MPTIYMILRVKNESKTWDIYELLQKFHNILKSDGDGGSLAMDVKDKNIFSLEVINGIPDFICKKK